VATAAQTVSTSYMSNSRGNQTITMPHLENNPATTLPTYNIVEGGQK
jgi:hypothetical protein